MKTVVSRVGSRQGWYVRELRRVEGNPERDRQHETADGQERDRGSSRSQDPLQSLNTF